MIKNSSIRSINEQLKNKQKKNEFIYNTQDVDTEYFKNKVDEQTKTKKNLVNNQSSRRLYENYYSNNIITGDEKKQQNQVQKEKSQKQNQQQSQKNEYSKLNKDKSYSFAKRVMSNQSQLNDDLCSKQNVQAEQIKQPKDWKDNRNENQRHQNHNFSNLFGRSSENPSRKTKNRSEAEFRDSWQTASWKTKVNNDYQMLKKPFESRQREMQSSLDLHGHQYSSSKQQIFDYDGRKSNHGSRQELMKHKKLGYQE